MKNRNLFWGVIFILAAALIIVSKLGIGILDGVNVFSILVSIVLVYIMGRSLPRRNWVGVLFPLAFLCIIYSDELGINALTPFPVLITAALGSVGLSFLFGSFPHHKEWKKLNDNCTGTSDSIFQENRGDINGDRIMVRNRFGETTKYVKSVNLQEALVDNAFGETTVYFDSAVPSADGATIRVSNSFGEVNLFIPKTWNIDNRLKYALADVSERGSKELGEGPLVVIEGDISLGECKISYI